MYPFSTRGTTSFRGCQGGGRQAKMLKPDERTEPFSKSSRHPNPLSLHIKTTPRSLQKLELSRNLWSSSPASLRLPHKDGQMLKLPGKGTCRETLHREVLAYNSRIRHSSEGVDFPEKYTKAPHVRLGGKFLQMTNKGPIEKT